MRQIDIFLKISDAQQCWFTCFVRHVNLKLFCRSANQNKNNFRFPTLKKHANNQTNWLIILEKIEENMELSRIYLTVYETTSSWQSNYLVIQIIFFIMSVCLHNDAFFTIEITNLPGILPQSPKKCAIWRKLIFFLCWISFYNSYFWYILGGFLICARTL